MSKRGDVSAVQEAPPRAYQPAAGEAGLPNLKPYPVMKDSGVPWLGEVPKHWEVSRLRNTADMRVSNVDKHTNDDEHPIRLCNYVDVYKNERIRSGMTFMRATATADEIERFRLRAGDVLITKDSETWNDIGVPALVVEADDDVVSGYHLALLRTFRERIYASYLFRALQSTAVAYQFHVEANGVTRYGLSHSAIKSVWLSLPPLAEQAAIVRFLDHADRRIRRYIRSKLKLIKLLEEQKQAIIYRAVTRGLDPDVRLKPSGFDWLGEVPQHWVVASLRFRYHQCLGKMVDAKRISGARLLPYLRNVDVRWDRINTVNLPQIDVAPEDHERYTVKVGDLLVCEGRHLGRAAFWRGELPTCAFQKALHRLRPRKRTRDAPRYLFYCLYVVHFKDAFGASSDDNSIPHLTGEMLRAHKFPFPPLEEQESIASHLDGMIATVDRARAVIEAEIGSVREYRTRLIADVVTGKVDVREAAAQLPDEADEPGESGDVEIPKEDEPEAAEDLADATTEVAAEVDD
jgi:type I restriction enzyme S subunit